MTRTGNRWLSAGSRRPGAALAALEDGISPSSVWTSVAADERLILRRRLRFAPRMVAEASGVLVAWLDHVVELGRRSVLDLAQWAELRSEHFARGVSVKELMRRTGLAQHDPLGAAIGEAA